MVDIKLSDEQKKFLEECENEFKDRYTEKDAAFMEIKNKDMNKPPIVEPWFVKRRSSRDWPRQNQNQVRHSHHGEQRHYNARHHRPDHHSRERRHRHSYNPY